jgi:hypothetical protein
VIRLMSLVPLLSVGGDRGFREQPLTADGWREFKTLTDEQREILRDQHGTWLRVHPHDHDAIKAIGLDFQRDAEGRPKLQDPLVDLGAESGKSGKTPTPDANKPTTASESNIDKTTTDEGGSTDPVTTIATETAADLGTAGKPKKKGH